MTEMKGTKFLKDLEKKILNEQAIQILGSNEAVKKRYPTPKKMYTAIYCAFYGGSYYLFSNQKTLNGDKDGLDNIINFDPEIWIKGIQDFSFQNKLIPEITNYVLHAGKSVIDESIKKAKNNEISNDFGLNLR